MPPAFEFPYLDETVESEKIERHFVACMVSAKVHIWPNGREPGVETGKVGSNPTMWGGGVKSMTGRSIERAL